MILRMRFVTLLAAILAFGLMSHRQQASAQTTGQAHVLIVVDNLDDIIGKSVALDRDDVKAMLEAGFKGKEERMRLTVLDGEGATPDGIRQYFAKLKIQPDDTLIFYFSGHGATHRTHGHFIALGHKPVLRSDLLEAIKAKKPRLAVCLTDCCASYYPDKPEVSRAVSIDWDTINSLLFRHRGVVDVNGCSVGEDAWCDARGSLFTRAFIKLLGKSPDDLGGESKEFVHWQDFVPHLKTETQENFRKLKSNKPSEFEENANQTPQAFLLPTHRFGVVGKASDAGIVVQRVYSGSPAKVAGFKPGDVIVKIGDKDVRSPEQLKDAIDRSGELAEVLVQPNGVTKAATRKVRLAE